MSNKTLSNFEYFDLKILGSTNPWSDYLDIGKLTLEMYDMKQHHNYLFLDNLGEFLECASRNKMECLQTEIFQAKYGMPPD